LSEEFTPHGPPPSGTGRAFSIHPAPVKDSLIFQVQWPELKPREYAGFEDHKRGELEKRLLQETEKKARSLETAAYEKGFAQGEKDGREAARKDAGAGLRQLQDLFESIRAQREEAHEKLERELVHLAFLLFRKILRRENPFPDAVIRETLRAAFMEVKERKEVRVRMNPGDYDDLCAAGSSSEPPGAEPWQGARIEPDPAITRGGCLLETSFGEIDATLETQFDLLAGLFWEAVRSGFPAAPHE
jgi:flagellar assembly protein FliH